MRRPTKKTTFEKQEQGVFKLNLPNGKEVLVGAETQKMAMAKARESQGNADPHDKRRGLGGTDEDIL